MATRDVDNMFIFKEEFIQKLKEDPARALAEVGITPTEEMLQALAETNIDALMTLTKALLPEVQCFP
jgi:hypothetical protein